ncbi:MAG: hypothetical protein CMN30_27660 [Sandaracinus sp.]|nr:hypothetical protein [Sandaracinus sp.]
MSDDGDNETDTGSSAMARGLGTLVGNILRDVTDPPTARVRAKPRANETLPRGYEDLGLIRSGGMGEVRRARDLSLERTVAIKLLHWEHLESVSHRERFEHEARVTASLQHPSVVPIYDRGVLEGGRPWFVMQEVRGETLAPVIAHLHSPDCRDPRGRARQVVGAMERMAQALAYAHSRGVVHRDIKPSNLMLGIFGEALVMDWGIARRGTDHAESTATGSRQALRTDTTDERAMTLAGDLLGTLPYLPPEVCRGLPHTAASDVYSFGLVLFELLTGRRAYESGPASLMARLQGEAHDALAQRLEAEATLGSEELRSLTLRTLRDDPEERIRDGASLAEQIRRWLDGDHRRRRARRLLTTARAERRESERLEAEVARAEDAVGELRRALPPYATVAMKRPLWAAEEELSELRRGLGLSSSRAVEDLRLALQHDPDLEAARAELVKVATEGLFAEERDGERSARWRRLVETFGTEAERAELNAPCQLTLELDRPSEVSVRPQTKLDRRWVASPASYEAVDAGALARTLDPGDYLVRVRRGPIEVQEHLRLRLRGRRRIDDLVSPFEGLDLGPDDVPIPAGWVTLGGDDRAADPLPERRVRTGAFVMKRHPVTHGEFQEFLDALVRSGREDLAETHVPRRTASDAYAGFARAPDGTFVSTEDAYGRAVEASWPVVLVTWHAACAYAEWLAAKTGLPWELPTEVQWARAARGEDGRHFPWGDEPEATWAQLLRSSQGVPGRAPVDACVTDESPFGVRGMAGNVRDWCADRWSTAGAEWAEALGELRLVRGGSWRSPVDDARSANRYAAPPDERSPVLGFRLVFDPGAR